jgi:hypothetical protein
MIGTRGWAALASAVLAAGVAAGCGSSSSLAGDPAPATSEAVVAVALSHLTPQPYSISYREPGAPIDDMGTKDPSLGGVLRWKPDPDWTLDVQVQPVPEDFPTCKQRGCVQLGDADLTWQDGGEDAPPAFTVSVVRDGELRTVSYEGGMEGDPRTSLLPFDLMELEEIVTDPAFSRETTTGAVEAGAKLAKDGVEGSRVEPRRLREPPPAPKTTPRALAAAVSEYLAQMGQDDLIRSGRADTFVEPGGVVKDAVWVSLTLRYGLTLHVTVIDSVDKDLNACQPTLTCWDWDGSVHAGREGLGGAFGIFEGHAVHTWLEGAGVHATTEDWFLGAEVGDHARMMQMDAASLAGLDGARGAEGIEGISPETTPELVEAGEKLAWFRD